MRFFFDYRTADRSLYDYQGHEFGTSLAAIELAGAIAEDLKHSLANKWIGWWIEARNPEGAEFVSLPIDAAEAIAA